MPADMVVKDLFTREFNVAYVTNHRYSLFATLIQSYPGLLYSGLSFTQLSVLGEMPLQAQNYLEAREEEERRGLITNKNKQGNQKNFNRESYQKYKEKKNVC